MKIGLSTVALAAAMLTSRPVFGLELHKRQDGMAPRVISMNTQRRDVRNPHRRDKVRRGSSPVQATLDNLETLYFVNATLGTPPQDFRLHIDTGSSDLWVNSADSDLCSKSSDPCSASGSYSANDSSTYEVVNSVFNISYADGSGAVGDYVTDDMHFGSGDGVDVEGIQFGVGYESSSAQSILGIGYPSLEVQVLRAGLKQYDNLPAKLVADGHTASQAFSLYLNSLESSTGSVLFGGVDTERFEGRLESLPIRSSSSTNGRRKRDDGPKQFLVELTGLSIGGESITPASSSGSQGSSRRDSGSGSGSDSGDFSLLVLLDSGSSLTYLPAELAGPIYEAVDAVYDEDEGVGFVSCDAAKATGDDDSGTNLTFAFAGPTISVPMSELVLDVTQVTDHSDSDGNDIPRPQMPDGSEACLFGISAISSGGQGGSSSTTAVLGDTFLRSAYAVYDMDNDEIWLAQTRFGAEGEESNVLEITGGKDGVPTATGIAGTDDAIDDDSAAVGRDGVAAVMGAVGGVAVGIAVFLV